jgi:hypothetical protein
MFAERASRMLTRVARSTPCGYADGVSGSLSNRGAALVRGKRAPIVGVISMDMLSLTDTRKSGNATPKQRQMIGEWLKANANTMESNSLGSVVLVESTLVRGALTAIDWVSGSRIRSEYVGNWNQAVDKVKELLVKHGLPYEDLTMKLRQAG